VVGGMHANGWAGGKERRFSRMPVTTTTWWTRDTRLCMTGVCAFLGAGSTLGEEKHCCRKIRFGAPRRTPPAHRP